MKAIRKIMVGCDLSDYSVETLAYAATLTEKCQAELIIVNVINSSAEIKNKEVFRCATSIIGLGGNLTARNAAIKAIKHFLATTFNLSVIFGGGHDRNNIACRTWNRSELARFSSRQTSIFHCT